MMEVNLFSVDAEEQRAETSVVGQPEGGKRRHGA